MNRACWHAVATSLFVLAGELAAQEQPNESPKEFTNGIGMKFVWIPPGSFTMGSPQEEEGRGEELQHKVTLTRGFYIGVYPVTQEQWQAVMGSNPSHHKSEKTLPVESVSWDDCRMFLDKMSKKEGRSYRLPTEAEWEFSCRAGTTTPFYFGETISTEQGNFNGYYPYRKQRTGLARKKTTSVGSFPANAWGLHDMHGNVWQWCSDWHASYRQTAVVDPRGPVEESAAVPGLILQLSSAKFAERQAATKALNDIGLAALQALRKAASSGPDLETQRRAEQLVAAISADNGDFRVQRGGSFMSPAALVRSANRSGLPPESRSFDVGFRAVADSVLAKTTK
jgi:formylglycine-generating enzyme required for sulfatase activity